MTNPPNSDSPAPDSRTPESQAPGTPPPPPAAGPGSTPAWNTAPDGIAGDPAVAPTTAPPAADYAAPTPGYAGVPGYAAAPAYPRQEASPPGRVLSIVGLILAFLAAPIGLILSIVAAVKLGKTGQPKGLAIAGIVVGAILTILGIIGIILFATVIGSLIGMCSELGAGVWEVDGVTYRCG